MKEKNVIYIPTLSLDEYQFAYASEPDWINDEFFKQSLEPGVFEMITDPAYAEKIKTSPDYQKNMDAFKTASVNLKKIVDAGITMALGTDSGAFPVRTQGFTEHLEMELMVKAGLTPMQAIVLATQNAAKALKIEIEYGTLVRGKKADLIILSANPLDDIKNTRKIEAVWKDGKPASKGPLSK
jgi:imidazolonepropionase-like amidohydrolase